MPWESVIGLEIHVQLATKSKLFSAASTQFGAEPNTQASAIDLGLPGVLPVLNETVIRMAILFGIAINAHMPSYSVFARKNYFYPDLPKGYQISQYELPIIQQGTIDIRTNEGNTKTVTITRAHLEEDAGKSIHGVLPGYTGVDLNRAGMPLLEIVSAPDLRSPEEAAEYMRTIHTLVQYLGISDGNMEEGSFRCDANVSIRPLGSTELGIRTEIKNLNSFRYVERALTHEIERQINSLQNNETLSRETRLFDSSSGLTRTMRKKEEEEDYRYFPDPDLLPIFLTTEFIESVRNELPELPAEKLQRFQTDYKLNHDDAKNITNSPQLAQYFEAVANLTKKPKHAANWILGELTGALRTSSITIADCPVSPSALACLLNRIADATLSRPMAKQIFELMWKDEGDPEELITNMGYIQISDTVTIDTLVESVIDDYPHQVEQYRSGKKKLLGFFVGKVMQITKGKGNPAIINASLQRKLNSD